jgi:hypothetical protein
VDSADQSPSLVQLWPEHFDISTDWAGTTFGASPGDPTHAEPYLYVSVSDDRIDRKDTFWNDAFGASLPYADLVGSRDPRGVAFAFFRAASARLVADPR